MFNSHVGILATLEILDSRIPGAAELVGVLECFNRTGDE